jgi:hypothetical protein
MLHSNNGGSDSRAGASRNPGGTAYGSMGNGYSANPATIPREGGKARADNAMENITRKRAGAAGQDQATIKQSV